MTVMKAQAMRALALRRKLVGFGGFGTIEDIFEVAAAEARRIVALDRLTIALLDTNSPAVELVSLGAGTRRVEA